jgi:transcriptional antiterminator RfaH
MHSSLALHPGDRLHDACGATSTNHFRWYAVQTQPHSEGRACSHLERQGFRIFFPRIRKTVRHSRQARVTLAPLFPGYLFLQFDGMNRWRSVNGTRGVVRILCQGDEPQPVPSGIVDALRARFDGDGIVNDTPEFKIGQDVRVAEGPFEDLVGTLEQFDGAGRVRVLLNLLGRSVAVRLRSDALVAVA